MLWCVSMPPAPHTLLVGHTPAAMWSPTAPSLQARLTATVPSRVVPCTCLPAARSTFTTPPSATTLPTPQALAARSTLLLAAPCKPVAWCSSPTPPTLAEVLLCLGAQPWLRSQTARSRRVVQPPVAVACTQAAQLPCKMHWAVYNPSAPTCSRTCPHGSHLWDTLLHDCTAGDGGGAALAQYATISHTRCTFLRNSVEDTGSGSGGALLVQGNVISQGTDSHFSGNRAHQGGVISMAR